jgi:hypothetical protein
MIMNWPAAATRPQEGTYTFVPVAIQTREYPVWGQAAAASVVFRRCWWGSV